MKQSGNQTQLSASKVNTVTRHQLPTRSFEYAYES